MPTIEVSSHESSSLQDVANALLKAKRVVVITGAGISTNSGIPDFRSENGLYSLIQAQFDAAARADSTRDRDDFPETQPRKRQRTGLSTSSGSGEGSRVHSDDGSRDEMGAELIAAARKLQEEQEGTAAPFTSDPKMGGQMQRMSLGASALLSSPLSSLPGGWEQYEDYMGSDIEDSEEKQEDNEGEYSDSQRSRALRTLPNIKGKDLFDAQIWSDPLRTSVFYTFATTLRQKVREAQPTPSHHFISHLRDRGKLVRCYTQNIDMIEEKVGLSTELEKGPGMRSRFTRKTTLQRAESMVAIESAATTESPNDSADETERISASQPLPKLSRISSDLSQMEEDCPSQSQGDFEDAERANDRRLKCVTGVECVYLHGSLEYLRCFVCAKTCEWDSVEAETMSGEQPECPHCAGATAARKERGKRALGIGKLRPDIVLYGEDHPKSHLISPIITNDLAAAPDMMLIMGTSLRVHGLKVMVREFAKAVHNKGGHVVFVNFTKPPESIWGDVIDYWVSWDCDAWVTDMKERIPLMWVPIGEEDEWKRKQKEVAKAAALEVKAAEKEAKAEAKAAEKEAKAEAKAAEKEAKAAQKAVEKAAKEEAKAAEREAKLEAKEREKQAKLEARLAQRSAKSGSASLTPNGSVEPDGKSSDGSSVGKTMVVSPDGTTIPRPKRKCTKRKKHEADTNSSIVSADHSGDQSSVMSLKDSRIAFTNGLRPSNAPTSAPTYTAYAAEVEKRRGGKLKTENVGQLIEESGDGSKNADSLTVTSMIQPELPVYPFIPMSAQKKTLEETQDAENRRRWPSVDSTKMDDATAPEDKSQAPPLLHNPFTSRANSYLPQRAPPLPIASTTPRTTETPTTTQAFTQIDPKSTVEYGPFKFDPFNPSKKIPRRMSMNMMPPMSTLPRSRRPSISDSLSKFAAESSVSSQTPRPRGHRKTLSWTQNPFFMQDSLVGSMKSPRNSISGGLGLGSFGSGFGGGFASGYGSGFMSNKPRTKSMSHFGLQRPSALSSLMEIEKSRQEMEYIHPTIEQDDDELELPKLPSEENSVDISWGPEDQLAAESEVGSRPITMEAVEDEDNVAVEDKEEEEEADVTVTEATDGDGAVVIKSEFSVEPEVIASKFFAKPKPEPSTETASQEPAQEPEDTPMSTDLETVTESPTPEGAKPVVSTSSKVAPKAKANTKDKAAKRKRAPVKRALPPPLMTRARTRVQAQQGKRVLRKRK